MTVNAFECRIPDVYIKAYKALVIPLLLYASPVWRPWLKRSIRSLESFQRNFIKRVAYKCDTSPSDICLEPICDILDARDLGLAHRFLRHPEFCDMFVRKETRTRSRFVYTVPLARSNVVLYSFRWRLSKMLSNR